MPTASVRARPRPSAAARTARPNGCSLPPCRLAASCKACASSTPGAGSNCTSCGCPAVRVPVLSKATTSSRCASSSACASLMRMPCRAATPVPAMIAAGVARPSAQGQAITITATDRISATSKPTPAAHQPSSVASATSSTTGTNTAATWSTRRWIGALAACASSTSRMMCDSTVSVPTAETCITSRPSPLMEPPVSAASRVSLTTGSGSPVSMDSSTWLLPSSTRPSSGRRSPGRTTRWSPTRMSATGTSTSPSGPSRCATSGRRACSARMAAVVWCLARTSSHLPSRTMVMTTADPSKYRCGMLPGSAAHHNQTDRPQPADVPRATSRSMLPAPARAACQPAR